ncbi:MAG: tRNA uridine-5-carboxymethylaminomethyl(34) synthesis GTPase MnmE [Desulfamplus sp.]|nr:tRNA uridine-5-carboxymethylaminomethyl(34) synthesis GTPase MnmE [Desulfamplus sp.]
MITDTIAAIATPPGAGGIGIIRISGSRAVEVVSQIFSKPSSIESHKVVHGYIVDDAENSLLDEVLLIPMLAPRSYTVEDVIEVHAHSGAIVMQSILELILSKDVRLAEPGEFTKRAFLNGRIDLTQAEAVADIINARSLVSLKTAVSQGVGHLRDTITIAREELISLLAQIEVSIDFPEEISHSSQEDNITVENNQNNRAVEVVNRVLDICNSAIKRYEDAHFLKDGLKIAICGPPNVGKSSLMNRLLERERSIVTQFPGTTRDLIEESLNINGIPFIISDTAGIHETDDPVEKIGIKKAKENIVESDMVLFVEDLSDIVLSKDFDSLRKRVEDTVPVDKKAIIVLNKIDKLDKDKLAISVAPPRPAPIGKGNNFLPLGSDGEGQNYIESYINYLPDKFSTIPVVQISAKCNIGIDILRKKIGEVAISNLKTTDINTNTNSLNINSNINCDKELSNQNSLYSGCVLNISHLSSVVPNIRHKTSLKKASKSLELALENLMNSFGNLNFTGSFKGFGEETLAIDIRDAIDSLGEITGNSAGVDILDNIFSKFCIGK